MADKVIVTIVTPFGDIKRKFTFKNRSFYLKTNVLNDNFSEMFTELKKLHTDFVRIQKELDL